MVLASNGPVNIASKAHHVGCVVSGRARARLADGSEREIAAGDVFDVPPGHDMWVIGDEPYVSVEFDLGETR